MGKKRNREVAKEDRHGPTCMCRRCRARDDALNREKTRKRKYLDKDYQWDNDY